MSNRPFSEYVVPQSVVEKIDQYYETHGGKSKEIYNELALWLEPSWRYAKRQGIEVEEYLKWAGIGYWNLEGDHEIRTEVLAYRDMAGTEGWILASAEILPEVAQEAIDENGVADTVKGAKVMIALVNLGNANAPIVEYKEPEVKKIEPIIFP
jgi:hypothetical protein